MAERGGLPWYCVWSDFSRHPKTLDLCGRVKDRNAGMYVIRLFEHCAEHALDGRIAAHAIEEAAGWRGRDGVLLAALEATGFIEASGEVRVVHGWEERNGGRIRKALRDAKNPRGNKPRSSAGPPRDASGTADGPALVDRYGDRDRNISEITTVSDPRPSRDPPPPTAREAGGGLERVQSKLAGQLGVPRLASGRQPERVAASFGRWLDRGLEDELVAECVRLAREKRVTPGSMAWWPGWLDTVPDEALDTMAAGGGA